MKISATLKSKHNQLETAVHTNGNSRSLAIAPKANGLGSSVNGGDLYREAAKRNITLTSVEVVSTGDFGAEGEPGSNFQYQVSILADAPASEIETLIRHTDQVAEVHNTLRRGLEITLINSSL
jgi:hypothetical protein